MAGLALVLSFYVLFLEHGLISHVIRDWSDMDVDGQDLLSIYVSIRRIQKQKAKGPEPSFHFWPAPGQPNNIFS